jgi:Predicted membrane protein
MVNRSVSIAPDRLEKALGGLALVMLAFVVVAVLKGMSEWARIPGVVWLHLVTICLALALTPVLLWQPRGTPGHRQLGYVWAGAMMLTAIDSLFVRLTNHGAFSPIHALSVMTIVLVPVLVLAARRHDVARHRRTVRGMIIGALLVAGFFTFPFGRLLGHWLFS